MSIKYNRANTFIQPAKAFEIFSGNVKKSAKQIKPSTFSAELYDIGDSFISQGNKQGLNSKFIAFAESLVGVKQDNLAGIIYSFLIKINSGNAEFIEKFATRALKIAKRQHDPVHIMARCDDLRRVLSPDKDKERLVRVLYDEKRALSDICKNYDGVKKRFNTLKREMKPVDQYRFKLSAIKAEIAELIIDEDPKQAAVEVAEAKEIIKDFGKGSVSKKLEGLTRRLSG